jgi:hypothetical protein
MIVLGPQKKPAPGGSDDSYDPRRWQNLFARNFMDPGLEADLGIPLHGAANFSFESIRRDLAVRHLGGAEPEVVVPVLRRVAIAVRRARVERVVVEAATAVHTLAVNDPLPWRMVAI